MFSNEIIQFVKNEGISEIIILSSTFSHEQHFIDKNPYEYVKNEKIEDTSGSLSSFNTSSALEKQIPGNGK